MTKSQRRKEREALATLEQPEKPNRRKVATRLGEALHTRFLRVAGAVVLILGLVSIEGGLNLMGSPYSFSNVVNAVGASVDTSADSSQGAAAAQPDVNGSIAVRVYNTAHAPNLIQAPPGKQVTLSLVTSLASVQAPRCLATASAARTPPGS